MSTVKALNFQVGQSVTATNNGTWYQPATPDGTIRYGIGNAGATTTDVVTLSSSGLSTTALVVSGSTAPTNGMFLPTTNTLAWSTNSTERLRLDASGNLGLGVTPSAWNSLVRAEQIGPRTSVFNFNNSNTYLTHNHYINTSSQDIYLANDYATMYRQSSGIHYWYTAPSGTAGNAISFTQAMTLDASGNLLVGDTAAPVTTRTYFKGSATSNSTWSIYAANSAGTVQFGLRNDNYFYAPSIGGYATTGNTVVVNGNYLGYLSSSLRFKKDIVDYDKGLTEILTLRPVYYKSKNPNPNGEYDEQRYAGLIAEEIADLGFDEFVLNGPDGQINSIQYGNMVALCVKAIQELSSQVSDLKTELNELKGKIA